MKRNSIFIVVILLLAALLRFWNLGNVPPSASMDEASIGYNAYSVLKTGVDEYGEFPIISQRGYDDFRRSTYLFLTIPFIAVFGLNAVSVRLPAVILSVLTVWATYHLVLLLFQKRSSFSQAIAFLSSFLLAISPWHIYISRLGHESNACLSFLVFGSLFFLRGVKKSNWILVLISLIFFILSMISYYSGQVFIPLFVLGLFIIFRKKLAPMILPNKKALVSFSILAVLVAVILLTIFSPNAMIRFQGTSILNPGATWQESHKREQAFQEAKRKNDFIGRIIYSKKLYDINLFRKGYMSHFNIKWLFANSGSEPFKIPGFGVLYIWEFPLIVIGMIYLLLAKRLEEEKKLLILWFFISPIPAALTTGAPHVMRTYSFLPTFQIFSSLGIIFLYSLFKSAYLQRLLIQSFFAIGILSIFLFSRGYFVVFPKIESSSFEYAASKAIGSVLLNEKGYTKIVFSNADNLYQSYMLFLYYSRYDPFLYRTQGGTVSGGFDKTHKFGKYEFRPINWKTESSNTLFIGNVSDFPNSIKTLRTFSDLDGKEKIKIVES